jgi:hypothetical protein
MPLLAWVCSFLSEVLLLESSYSLKTLSACFTAPCVWLFTFLTTFTNVWTPQDRLSFSFPLKE